MRLARSTQHAPCRVTSQTRAWGLRGEVSSKDARPARLPGSTMTLALRVPDVMVKSPPASERNSQEPSM